MKPYNPEDYDFDECFCRTHRGQHGGHLPVVFRGNQRGDGFGSFFRGLYRAVLPLVKKGAKAVGKQAMKSGVALIGDVAAGHDLREAAKHRLDQFGDELVHTTEDKIKSMTGGRRKNNKRDTVAAQQLFGVKPLQRRRKRKLSIKETQHHYVPKPKKKRSLNLNIGVL